MFPAIDLDARTDLHGKVHKTRSQKEAADAQIRSCRNQ